MYRPNRLGPFSQWDPAGLEHERTASFTGASFTALSSTTVLIPRATALEFEDELIYRSGASGANLNGGNIVAMAVPLLTNHQREIYQYVVSGSLHAENLAEADVNAWPFIGELDNTTIDTSDTTQVNPMEGFIPLPAISNHSEPNAADVGVNESVLVTQPLNGAKILVAGFFMRTETSVAIQFVMHMHFQKYVADIDVFDPNQ